MSDIDPFFDAFRLHDERGLPLTVAMGAGLAAGGMVNLAAFACDALNAGWSSDKTYSTIAEACCDNGIPFDRGVFEFGMLRLWTFVGRGQTEPWKAMKRFIVETPERMATT